MSAYKHTVTADAATLLIASPRVCVETVNVNTAGAGSVEIHDCATAGGIDAGTLVAKIDTAVAQVNPMEATLRLGLVYVKTGTADVTIVWE